MTDAAQSIPAQDVAHDARLAFRSLRGVHAAVCATCCAAESLAISGYRVDFQHAVCRS